MIFIAPFKLKTHTSKDATPNKKKKAKTQNIKLNSQNTEVAELEPPLHKNLYVTLCFMWGHHENMPI